MRKWDFVEQFRIKTFDDQNQNRARIIVVKNLAKHLNINIS